MSDIDLDRVATVSTTADVIVAAYQARESLMNAEKFLIICEHVFRVQNESVLQPEDQLTKAEKNQATVLAAHRYGLKSQWRRT